VCVHARVHVGGYLYLCELACMLACTYKGSPNE